MNVLKSMFLPHSSICSTAPPFVVLQIFWLAFYTSVGICRYKDAIEVKGAAVSWCQIAFCSVG